MYIFFNTATYEEIERDVKVETTLWVLTKRLHLKSQKSLLSTTCKVTTEAALGLIGGTMGLLTGFSILSGIEIIYYLFRFYIHIILSAIVAYSFISYIHRLCTLVP